METGEEAQLPRVSAKLYEVIVEQSRVDFGSRPGSSFQLKTKRDRRNELQFGNTGVRRHDLPAIVKLLEVHCAGSHHRPLGGWK
jgi:hypothetical protein